MVDDNKENVTLEQIDSFTVHQLKNFLRSYNQTVTGRSSELKTRAKGVLKLRLPTNDHLNRVDERERRYRSLSKFVTPLGENLPKPEHLKSGWTDDVFEIPEVTEKELYNYLVFNSCRTFDGDISGARKQVKARVFYEDNHVYKVQFHPVNSDISHGYVKCKVIPSMPSACPKKDPDYDTWISLSKHTGQVHAAHCSCTAGEGESCNHVAALLWCLVDVTLKKRDGTLATTSEQCKWNQPRRRKLSPRRAEEITFKKVSKKTETHSANYSAFNPSGITACSSQDDFRKSLASILPNAGFHKLFPKEPIPEEIIKMCCLPDPPVCFMQNISINSDYAKDYFNRYESELCFNPEDVELHTRGQRNNGLWQEARKGRVTASNFGTIINARKFHSILKTVMGFYKSPSSDALEWGKKREKNALTAYTKELKKADRTMHLEESGLMILKEHPYIGASPDGVVFLNNDTEIGLVEVKCPYKYRHLTPEQACEDPNFFCETSDAGQVVLKTSHRYFFQVQGQMGIRQCTWCDFVVWTTKGLSVQRVNFDADLWESMLKSLVLFYREAVLPEVFTCQVKRGIV